jgi:hypothetical protein
MKIHIGLKTYEPTYIPFFRVKPSDRAPQANKYGIRWPSGHIEYVFIRKTDDQIQEMKEILKDTILVYTTGDKEWFNNYDRRMLRDVCELFKIPEERNV